MLENENGEFWMEDQFGIEGERESAPELTEEELKESQYKIAESIEQNIPYQFENEFLVKPLPEVRHEVEREEIDTESPKDKDGRYTKTKMVKTEVSSDYREGVVVSVPTSYILISRERWKDYSETDRKKGTYNVGDTVVYLNRNAKEFDLFKNAYLVRHFDVIGKRK